jgi:hypothetical protein
MAHEEFRSCIDACYACAAACDHCASACLSESDPGSMANCIKLDIDCAEICRLAAGYMARGSAQARRICAVCAEICEACAAECDKFTHDHCRECAQACRRCAEECRRMAA